MSGKVSKNQRVAEKGSEKPKGRAEQWENILESILCGYCGSKTRVTNLAKRRFRTCQKGHVIYRKMG